jgi:hypothetical protein
MRHLPEPGNLPLLPKALLTGTCTVRRTARGALLAGRGVLPAWLPPEVGDDAGRMGPAGKPGGLLCGLARLLDTRLLPFTVDGLILAGSMLILDANRRNQPVPPLARWCLGAGIMATISANMAHGLGRGPIGAW